jgi:hypothetical protein
MKENECSREHCVCHTPAAQPKFDAFSFIIDFEEGSLDEAQIIEGFQALINSGLVWQLQGSYGRTAMNLIESERCTRR